jgi:signal transduction histidine kinase
MAARAQQRLASFSAAPAAVGALQAAEQRAALAARVDAELATLRRVALHARQTAAEQGELAARLEKLIDNPAWQSVFVVRSDTLLGWAGTLHASPRALVWPSGVAATPFGFTLYAESDSAGVRAVATSLLYAAPPADRLTRGLSQRLPGTEITEGFTFSPPADPAGPDALRYVDDGRVLFVARAIVPSNEEVRFRMLERARVRVGVALLIALIAFLVAAARRESGAAATLGAVLVVLRCIAVVPLSEYSTRSRLFDASVYFLPAGRAFSANAAALALTSATLLFAALLVTRRARHALSPLVGATIALVGAMLGPYFVRALSRGIAPPSEGAGAALWMIWEIPLCLAATSLLVIATWGGHVALRSRRRGVDPAAGPAVAALAAIVAPLVWMAPGQWPSWYGGLWVVALLVLVAARPSRHWLLAAASVAALGATTVVWGSTSRGRVELAERDVRGLNAPDAYAATLQDRLAADLVGDSLPHTSQALLAHYVQSDLAASAYPVALASWEGDRPVATFGSAPFDVAWDTVMAAAVEAQRRGAVEGTYHVGAYGVRVVAVPVVGGAITILVAPHTRLIGTDAYARWFGLSPSEGNEPPYTVQVFGDSIPARDSIRWRRENTELHGDWPVRGPEGAARAHVEVDLRGLDSLIPRGGLLLLADLAAVGLVWLLASAADGRVGRWLRLRRRRVRSYRTRLSLALFFFFLVPAVAFAVWSWQQLFTDAQQSRRLLVTETMRAVSSDPRDPDWLRNESRRLDTKLLLYNAGVLVDASDSLFAELAPLGSLLRPDVNHILGEEESATRPEPLAGATGMMGYRLMPGSRGALVLAAPARFDDVQLDRRRRDLGVLVLFATAVGALAALWLSAVAARQLARPIGALRAAARSVARGERELALGGEETNEFDPVFRAFEAMAEDLARSRAALVEAQRRTDAVLRTVASGVVALDEQGRVILANPRADSLLGELPRAGEPVNRLSSPVIAARLAGFLRSGAASDEFDIERDGRSLRGQLSRLASGGAVLTIDDVTELSHAQRVLAWGEMARQVAHEIKNPLTPIRLGVQHLRRARGRPDFDAVLDQNVSRILDEIDRLDEIARAFSRYGGAPEERPPAEPTDVVAIVRDVVALEQMGEGGVHWSSRVDGSPPQALARGDELREVLLNIFENARHAGAHAVTAAVCHAHTEEGAPALQISVADDGTGIAEDVLPRIFEPHFSTRTSGSGLGLAISRRLVESWGGTMTIESTVGRGTVVQVVLKAARG